MNETSQILALWRRARARGDEVCLATVVHVERSSYRKPGARMLVTSGGERAGTISGGCLEAAVSRKAWWLTRNGPAVEVYDSSFDEDGSGTDYGLGCGGTITLLLEREPHTVLDALAAARERGQASVIVHRLWGQVGSTVSRELEKETPETWTERMEPPPRLLIYGAGEDSQPLARFADEIGWRVAVADGRRYLLLPERFPEGVRLVPLQYSDPAVGATCVVHGGSPEQAAIAEVQPGAAPGEYAVLMTHSYEQDRALLRALLPVGLRYLGILGPRHRTARLVDEIAPTLGWTPEQCWGKLRSPVGLNLGTRDPATIALAIAAELLATQAGREVHIARLPA